MLKVNAKRKVPFEKIFRSVLLSVSKSCSAVLLANPIKRCKNHATTIGKSLTSLVVWAGFQSWQVLDEL
jgi:hypothetical protein